jgi:predicted RNase H-like HicB family nuclease/predicted RNA binding protein YcfA (HicA-like mRNA interferase family)
MDYQYTVYFEPLVEGGHRVVFPAIPEIVTFGRSLDEAREMARDALRCHLEGLMQDGEPIPIESNAPEGTPVKETLAITV